MKSFKTFLLEAHSNNKTSNHVVDIHLSGHFGSGKSTAIKEAHLQGKVNIIDLDKIDGLLQKKYGKKPATSSALTKWHQKFKEEYIKTVEKLKQNGKPIVVVGHNWENDEKFAPVEAKQKIYIDISKDKLFKQRKERDKNKINLTTEYLESEYKSVQKNLDAGNYEKMSFSEVVKRLKSLGKE